MHRPKFKDKYHIEPVEDAVFLLSERDTFVLEGQSLARVVPLIDGVRSSDEIVAAAWPTVLPNDVSQALNLLNSELTLEWAQSFASRVIALAGADLDRQIETAFA